MAELALAAGALAATPPAPFGPLPSERQLKWQALEESMFIHFGVNTFTGVEWGEGTESPAIFNPTELDCRQWARVAKDAGLRGIVITAKHHDGFCLWPSALTTHSVAQAPWRGGKGDVLKELSTACREAGLGFGVYLSPWDRNNPKYGSGAEYNQYFASQLRDVLTHYGPVFEVWFDGACGEGPDGRRQVYDWPLFVSVVRECQPGAVIFSDAGPDIRWVGNESGYGCETNWSRLSLSEFHPGIPGRNEDLCHGQRDGANWIMAEVDVSIRPGWFFRETETAKVKSVEDLKKIWLESIGRNCNLLLNVPVDRRGLIADADMASLAGWGSAVRAMTATDIAPAAALSAPSTRAPGAAGPFDPKATVDGDPHTYFATDDAVTNGSIEYRWTDDRRPRLVRIEEAVELGQRVESFVIETMGASDAWTEVARGTTIGARRILELPPTPCRGLRLVIQSSRACPCVARVSIYE